MSLTTRTRNVLIEGQPLEEQIIMLLTIQPFQNMREVPVDADGNANCTTDHKWKFKPITGLCPVQKVKVMDTDGMHIEMLAMLASGSYM